MIFRSPYADVEIPEISLPRFVLERAREFGDKPAVIDGLTGRTITYSQLDKRVRHTAKSLAQRGYRKGDVFVVDRIKELIKVKAMQVAPAELESVLLQNQAVADVAVIGAPDLEAGEVPKAFVVCRSEISAEALMAYVAERVAPHKQLRHVEFIEAIPKSPAGKILRRVLVERERAQMYEKMYEKVSEKIGEKLSEKLTAAPL